MSHSNTSHLSCRKKWCLSRMRIHYTENMWIFWPLQKGRFLQKEMRNFKVTMNEMSSKTNLKLAQKLLPRSFNTWLDCCQRMGCSWQHETTEILKESITCGPNKGLLPVLGELQPFHSKGHLQYNMSRFSGYTPVASCEDCAKIFCRYP